MEGPGSAASANSRATTRRQLGLRLGILVLALLGVVRGFAPRPGFARTGEFPICIGAPLHGELALAAWSSFGGGAIAEVAFDARFRWSSVFRPQADGALLDERWSELARDFIGHVWFARNALLHCPPGTFTAPLAFEYEGARVRHINGELHVQVPTGQWRSSGANGIGRHRIEVESYRATQDIFSRDHALRFAMVAHETDWVNVTLHRYDRRLDVVLRFFARHPNRELLTQRLTFVGSLGLPVAIEADWGDPFLGHHELHELFVQLDSAELAELSASNLDAAGLRNLQRRRVQGQPDPWTESPRPEDIPVIGPLRPGFADPDEAFVPWKPPLRLRGGSPR